MFNAPVRNDDNIPELDLLARIADGDRSAFRQLYDIHSDYIYNLCFRMLGNSDDAHEVAQDVFVALWRKAHSIRGESRLRTWLHRVAVNRSINFRKRGGVLSRMKQIMSIDTEKTSLSEQLPAPASTQPDTRLESKEAKVLLAELMSDLPERQREAFLLHKLEGLSYREIAEEMGLSLPAIESLIHRAKLKLKDRLVKKSRQERKKEEQRDV